MLVLAIKRLYIKSLELFIFWSYGKTASYILCTTLKETKKETKKGSILPIAQKLINNMKKMCFSTQWSTFLSEKVLSCDYSSIQKKLLLNASEAWIIHPQLWLLPHWLHTWNANAIHYCKGKQKIQMSYFKPVLSEHDKTLNLRSTDHS